MGGAGSLIRVHKAGEMNQHKHTQKLSHSVMHSIAGTYAGLSETQTITYKCASVSHALWPCSYQVRSLSFCGLAICQGHTHAHTCTHMHTHAQPNNHTNFRWWQFVLPPSTETCVHSNQESTHSGTQKPRQLLVSTEKCVWVNLLLFCLWCKCLSCTYFGFPSIMKEFSLLKQAAKGISHARFLSIDLNWTFVHLFKL